MIKFILKETLKELYMNQSDLAIATNIRPNTISTYCNNTAKSISLDNLEKICTILDVPINKVIEFKSDITGLSAPNTPPSNDLFSGTGGLQLGTDIYQNYKSYRENDFDSDFYEIVSKNILKMMQQEIKSIVREVSDSPDIQVKVIRGSSDEDEEI